MTRSASSHPSLLAEQGSPQENIHYWIPPVPEHEPASADRSNRLKMAVLVDERLFTGLRLEAHLLLLTPDNYADVIRKEQPDLVLIESCTQSVTGHWKNAQDPENPLFTVLDRMIRLAGNHGIPCCYWLTLDHSYGHKFTAISRLAEHIFCADPKAVELLKKEGITSILLPPAMQPRIHNPLRIFQEHCPLSITTLFDGWNDLLYFGDRLPLKLLKIFDLRIIDSRHSIPAGEIDRFPEYKELILGSVSKRERLTTLRYSRTAISFEESLATPTEQAWMSVETAGCRVPLVHLGTLDSVDIRNNLCIPVHDTTAMRAALARLLEEPVHRENSAQRFWREAHTHHTFGQRLQAICNKLAIKYSAPGEPGATIITPTNRPGNIKQVLANFKRQNYPHKELIIVYNGPPDSFREIKETVARENNPEIRLQYLPTEYFAGAALNIGAHMAKGSYCFRMDDDDHYADHYLSDTMLHLKTVHADIFGKPPVHLFFSTDQELYLRHSSSHALHRLDNRKIHRGEIWLGGNTIGGRTDILRQHGYQDTVFGTADSAFQVEVSRQDLKIYSFDQNNVVAVRREENSHTWRYDNERLKKNSSLAAGLTIEHFFATDPFPDKTFARSFIGRGHSGRPTVLYLGPQIFRDGVWQNRVKYIFPDLLGSLAEHFSIHMLTGPVPPFARQGIEELTKKFGIIFHELPRRLDVDPYIYWIQGGKRCAEAIGADILTNPLGGVLFGYALTFISRLLNTGSIIRVSGDEIASRLALGEYLNKPYTRESTSYKKDMRRELLAYNRSDRIIVLSPRERQRVIEQGASPEKVRVVIRGIDLDRFQAGPLPLKKPVTKFLFIGRNSLEKGFDLIEKAATRLQTTHPRLKFIFAGNFEKKKKGNRNYIGFVPTEKLPALYQSVDAVILSSRTEGMPQVVLEAMASAKPCIVSRHLFETQFTNGVQALLTDLDPDDLVRQIIRLHEDLSLANRLATTAREYAEQHFDKNRLQNDYRDVFLELLETGEDTPISS